MPRFIVFSYDPDQQQNFTDYVEAVDAADAGFQILDRRSYCGWAITHSPESLRNLADQCELASQEELSP